MQKICFEVDDETNKALKALVVVEKGSFRKQSEFLSELVEWAIAQKEM